MNSEQVVAYLENEIVCRIGIVTYRLLSRKFSMHVNAAKNSLASFYSRKRENGDPIYATFWLSGEPYSPLTNGGKNEMDVDRETRTDWSARKIIIVGEEDLEIAKAAFSKIHALHVYSLSSTPLTNASQLCGPSREVREMDRTGGDDLECVVGKVVSRQVKRGVKSENSIKGTSTKPPASTSLFTTPKPEETPSEKPKVPQVSKATEEKPRLSGKLDWSRAKTKDAVKELHGSKNSIPTEDPRKNPVVYNAQKRGTKGKSVLMSQLRGHQDEETSEKEVDVASTNDLAKSTKAVKENILASARVKKGVVLSDDEDEQTASKTGNSVGRNVRTTDESDGERSVRAMMDIDDDVTKASKPSRSTAPGRGEDEEPPTTDQNDSAMDEDSDDPAPKAKTRKRKQKKEIPIGRNGLRKKRVVKSKTDFDEKGYMVTVDYSSYESVDEEEEATFSEKKSHPKFKSAAMKKVSSTKNDLPASGADANIGTQSQSAAAPKKTGNKKTLSKPPLPKGRQSNGSQRNLASFFGSGGSKPQK